MPLGLENPLHLLIVLVVVLLVFGAKRLPETGRSLGKGLREFRNGVLGHEAPEAPGGPSASPTELPEHVAKGEGQ